jgi:hypothetical protein
LVEMLIHSSDDLFLEEIELFFLRHKMQTGCGTHSAPLTYIMVPRDSLPPITGVLNLVLASTTLLF